MRRTLLLYGLFCLAACGPQGARAGEDLIVERMAADFYENNLRLSQSRNIEAATAQIYRGLEAAKQADFRRQRRRQWRAMDEDARRSLRGVETPRYENLTEAQKAPFRRAAAGRLGAGGVDAGDDGV